MVTLSIKLSPSTKNKIHDFLYAINPLVWATMLGLIFMTVHLYHYNNTEISKRDYILLNDIVKKGNNPTLKLEVQQAMKDQKITHQEFYNITH